jgi:hypothetical protein
MWKEVDFMARITVDEMIAGVAAAAGMSLADTERVLDAQAEMIFKYAKLGVPVVGVGVAELHTGKARTILMRFGPMAGQTISIPPPRRATFRFLKAAKLAMIHSEP